MFCVYQFYEWLFNNFDIWNSGYLPINQSGIITLGIFWILAGILVFANILKDDKKGLNQRITVRSILKIIFADLFFWLGLKLLKIV
jgi:hypothetical protein